MNKLPNKLLKLRKHYNYSQAYIASILGVEVIDYMAFENGRAVLNFEQCKKIAILYHVGVEEIFKNSEEVTLYDVSKTKTDELNIEYFLPPKTIKERLLDFLSNKLLLSLFIIVLVILGLLVGVLLGKQNKPSDVVFESSLEAKNRLSISETTVVYIAENGAVRGSGDNTNGQLSNLPSESVVSVKEGSSFTIVLKKDGTVECIGLIEKYKNEIELWTNIIEIAVGDNHVVGLDINGTVYAVGDNSYGQCEVSNFKHIKHIFGTKRGTVVCDESGKLDFCGELTGSSQLKNYENILDIDSSDDNLVILTNDGLVEYFAKEKSFLNIYKWKEVVDICCGNDYVAALLADGTVVLDCEDVLLKKEVATWSNIIAIDGEDDYLIGYDGEEIYGTGKNDYHQFTKEITQIATLPQVSGVKIAINNTVDVSFDKVVNAQGYELKLNVDDGIVYRVSSNQTVSFYSDNFKDGNTYQITITSLGDLENYLDSSPLVVDFVYYKQADTQEQYVQIDCDFTGMPVNEFLAYLNEIGVPDTNIIGIENGDFCQDEQATIISVNGLSFGQKISKNELLNVQVSYNYCRINTENRKENKHE